MARCTLAKHAAIAALLLIVLCVPAFAETTTSSTKTTEALQPFFEQFCFDCHGPDSEEAGLNFAELLSQHPIVRNRETWHRVIQLLELKAMPPEDELHPSDDERGELLKGLDQAHQNYLLGRYRRPRPRLDFGVRLLGHAHAAIDVSDGLIADLGHICTCSGVGARLAAQAVPLSDAAQAALGLGEGKLADLLTGGDDYELLFTAPPEDDTALRAMASDLAVDVTRIGSITDGGGLEVEDGDGSESRIGKGGYRHFR